MTTAVTAFLTYTVWNILGRICHPHKLRAYSERKIQKGQISECKLNLQIINTLNIDFVCVCVFNTAMFYLEFTILLQIKPLTLLKIFSLIFRGRVYKHLD